MPKGNVHWKNSKGDYPNGYIVNVNPVLFLALKEFLVLQAGPPNKFTSTGRKRNSTATKEHICEYIRDKLLTLHDSNISETFANKVDRDLWNSAELSFAEFDLNRLCECLELPGLFRSWEEFETACKFDPIISIGESYTYKSFFKFNNEEVQYLKTLANIFVYSTVSARTLNISVPNTLNINKNLQRSDPGKIETFHIDELITYAQKIRRELEKNKSNVAYWNKIVFAYTHDNQNEEYFKKYNDPDNSMRESAVSKSKYYFKIHGLLEISKNDWMTAIRYENLKLEILNLTAFIDMCSTNEIMRPSWTAESYESYIATLPE